MCKAGFDVLEMFPITASYMPGPYDVLHYSKDMLSAIEDKLEMYIENRSENPGPEVCIS